MNLMPKELEKQIPPLYTQDGKGKDAIVHTKFFIGSWSWYVLEYSPEEKICFGYVVGQENEYGYFSLTELEELRVKVNVENLGSFYLTVERDLYWEPKPIKDIPDFKI